MRSLLLATVLLVSAAPMLAVEGQWSVLGPDGGGVTALAFQPGSDQVLYAAVTGGMYKSRDAGATWTWAGTGLVEGAQTTSVAVDPVHPETVYASQGDVFRSVDGGQTWKFIRVGGSVYQVAVHPRSSGAVFAASTAGIFRTSDGGVTWSRMTQGLPKSYGARLIAFDPSSQRRMYAFLQAEFDAPVGMLARSTDGGTTWQVLRNGPQQNQRILSLAVDPRARGTLYAGTNRAVYKSTDSGTTWRGTSLAAGFVWTLKVHPRLGSVYAGTDAGLFRSDDGGATWTRLFQGLEGKTTFALAFSPFSAQTIYAGISDVFERGGVFKSGDGGRTWAFSGHGISALSVRQVAVDPTNPARLWVIANDVPFRSTDRGRSWERVRPGPVPGDIQAAQAAVDPLDGSTVYLLLADGTLRRTHDGGQTWETAGHLTPPYGSFLGSQIQLVIDPQQPVTLYAAGLGISKSTDGGATWAPLPGVSQSLVVFDLAISPSLPSTLYATVGGLPGDQVIRSLDGGATWTQVTQDLPDGLISLTVDPHLSTTVYGVYSPRRSSASEQVYRTTDGGGSWSLLDLPFIDPVDRNILSTVAISPSGALYVGVWLDNVYESRDGGGSWEPLGTNPPGRNFSFLAVDPGDPCQVYATADRGLLAFTEGGPRCD
jgi:photosystem II stability/assembly factor-like uncharacterized protein